MLNGRAPTHSVMIPVKFIGKDGKEHTKWHRVGAAWQNKYGKFNFNIVTIPGVSFQLIPERVGEWDEEVNREITLEDEENVKNA